MPQALFFLVLGIGVLFLSLLLYITADVNLQRACTTVLRRLLKTVALRQVSPPPFGAPRSVYKTFARRLASMLPDLCLGASSRCWWWRTSRSSPAMFGVPVPNWRASPTPISFRISTTGRD